MLENKEYWTFSDQQLKGFVSLHVEIDEDEKILKMNLDPYVINRFLLHALLNHPKSWSEEFIKNFDYLLGYLDTQLSQDDYVYREDVEKSSYPKEFIEFIKMFYLLRKEDFWNTKLFSNNEMTFNFLCSDPREMLIEAMLEQIAVGERLKFLKDHDLKLNGDAITLKFACDHQLDGIKKLLNEEISILIIRHLDSQQCLDILANLCETQKMSVVDYWIQNEIFPISSKYMVDGAKKHKRIGE